MGLLKEEAKNVNTEKFFKTFEALIEEEDLARNFSCVFNLIEKEKDYKILSETMVMFTGWDMDTLAEYSGVTTEFAFLNEWKYRLFLINAEEFANVFRREYTCLHEKTHLKSVVKDLFYMDKFIETERDLQLFYDIVNTIAGRGTVD